MSHHHPNAHPSPEILAAFAQGRSSGEGLQELEQHIAGCTECAATLERMESDSDLVRRVGSAVNNKPATATAEVSLTFLEPSPRAGALGRIGHYDVLEILGRGGFGIVLKAFDESLQRIVALKILAPELAATSPARKRFLREARAAAAVRHENVVQIYSVYEQPLPYLVMEFIPGENLQQRLDRTGPVDSGEMCDIGRQIAAGLAAAHAQGLVHRDIKPANVLLDSSLGQRVKITDFGLARAVDDASITQSGIVAGTPLYMAPEQARGEVLDPRTDLFSLGSVLYVMLSGRPPFRAPNTVAVLKRVCEDIPRPIPEIIPDAPPALCQLISRLHAKQPAGRIQTAQEVVELLSPSSVIKTNTQLLASSEATVTRSTRARRWGVATVAALAVMVLFVIAQFHSSNRPDREKQSLTTAPFAHKVPPAMLSGPGTKVSSTQRNTSPAAVVQRPLPAVTPDGMALEFDGQTSYVQVDSLSRDAAGPATLEAWVRPEFRPHAHVVALLSGKSVLQLTQSFSAFFPVEINTRLTSGDAENPQFVPGEWVHVALVVDDREVRIYMNGDKHLQIARNAAAAHSPYVYGGLWLGAQPHPGRPEQIAFNFLGQIDEVRVSNIARYSENFTPAVRQSPDENTLALYHCDEGSGLELKDASGHNHHGKVVAVNWVARKSDPRRTARSLINGDEAGAIGEKEGPATWRVINQQLIGESSTGGTSKLRLGRQLPARFRLRCEARITGNSGIDVGVYAGGGLLQAYHVELAGNRSGSIAQVVGWKWLALKQGSPAVDGNWMTLEIVVDKALLTSFINGQQAATIAIPEHLQTDLKLELDAQGGPSKIEIRKFELQAL